MKWSQFGYLGVGTKTTWLGSHTRLKLWSPVLCLSPLTNPTTPEAAILDTVYGGSENWLQHHMGDDLVSTVG